MSLRLAALGTLAALLARAQVFSNEFNGTTITYTVTQDTGADVPLASKKFNYPFLPYKADTGDGPRGIMTGTNLCNSTTLGPDSLCATGFLNTVEDFCLWGAPEPNSIVGNVEGEMVAYCTTPKYGTRVLPAGAIKGIQFTKTPGYVQVVGFIDQTALNIQASDYGGEEDNKGADNRGNPLGSLMYSSAWGPGPSSIYIQATDWSYFVGSGQFCFKVCDPSGPNSARLCEHVYDRIGCAYNAPADYSAINNTFTSCQGDNQLPVGVYVGDNGRTSTWYQPPESEGPINSVGYTPAVPSSSQCSTFTSSALFTEVTTTAGPSTSTSASSGASTSTPASASTANQAAQTDSSSGASQVAKSTVSGLLAVGAAFWLL